jgi:predicted small lipoprotein YifL
MGRSTSVEGLRSCGVVLVAALTLAGCGQSGQRETEPGAADRADPSVERFLDRTLPEGASGSLVAAREGDMVH